MPFYCCETVHPLPPHGGRSAKPDRFSVRVKSDYAIRAHTLATMLKRNGAGHVVVFTSPSRGSTLTTGSLTRGSHTRTHPSLPPVTWFAGNKERAKRTRSRSNATIWQGQASPVEKEGVDQHKHVLGLYCLYIRPLKAMYTPAGTSSYIAA